MSRIASCHGQRGLGAGAIALTGLALVGCAPTYAKGYQEAFDHGLAAQNAGRYDEAATRFHQAASLGDRYKDRDEARLLEAESLEHMGRFADADATYARIVAEGGGRYQAVRAEFWRARLVTRWKGREAGDALMLAAVERHPSSGLARHAMRRMLGVIEEEKGPDEALTWLDRLEPFGKKTDLEEEIAYERGLVLFRAGRYERARDVLVASARAHPYPNGSLTDDALYQASLLEEELGHIDAAIALLVEMHAPREAAYTGSSYERPRFPQAQLRIGRLYRDQKHDPERAKKELRKVCTDYPASRLCDEALWEEAAIENGPEGERRSVRVDAPPRQGAARVAIRGLRPRPVRHHRRRHEVP